MTQTIRVAAGQAVVGTGGLGAANAPGPEKPQFVARQIPFIRRSDIVARGFTTPPQAAGVAGPFPPVFELASGSRLAHLVLSHFNPRENDPQDTVAPAIRLTRAARVELVDLQIGREFLTQMEIGARTSEVVADGVLCVSGRITFASDARHCTFWGCTLNSEVQLDGADHALWTGVIEPTLRDPAFPAQVIVQGVGCSVFANRIEGHTFPGLRPVFTAGILIRGSADFTEISTPHQSREGFDVQVDRDAGAGLIRTLPHTASSGLDSVENLNVQPLLDVGLSNFLKDATLDTLDPDRVEDSPWRVGPGLRTRLSAPGRALARAATLSGAPGGEYTLSQGFRGSPADGIE